MGPCRRFLSRSKLYNTPPILQMESDFSRTRAGTGTDMSCLVGLVPLTLEPPPAQKCHIGPPPLRLYQLPAWGKPSPQVGFGTKAGRHESHSLWCRW